MAWSNSILLTGSLCENAKNMGFTSILQHVIDMSLGSSNQWQNVFLITFCLFVVFFQTTLPNNRNFSVSVQTHAWIAGRPVLWSNGSVSVTVTAQTVAECAERDLSPAKQDRDSLSPGMENRTRRFSRRAIYCVIKRACVTSHRRAHPAAKKLHRLRYAC